MASEGPEIGRLILATQRSLAPALFPPRRDIDFVCLGSGVTADITLFHDAFWARQDRFSCVLVRIGGGVQGRLGAHTLKALLRAALRVYPADRALDLSLRAFHESLPGTPVDAAVLCLCPETGAATFGAHGDGQAMPLASPLAAPLAPPAAVGAGGRGPKAAHLDVGAFCWLSVGGPPVPGGGEAGGAEGLVRAAIAGRPGSAAAAVELLARRALRGRLFVLSNDVTEISPVLAEVEEYILGAGVRPEAVMGLDVALDELLTNVVLYAYGDGRAHEIVIHVLAEGPVLTVEIRDDGTPFDPTAADAPDSLDGGLDERPIGGLGLHFVRTIFETLDYRRDRGWNVLTLSKPLGDAGAPGPSAPHAIAGDPP